jgi:hypothetical protein
MFALFAASDESADADIAVFSHPSFNTPNRHHHIGTKLIRLFDSLYAREKEIHTQKKQKREHKCTTIQRLCTLIIATRSVASFSEIVMIEIPPN